MDRVLAYSSRLYSEQLKKGEGFGQLMPVYSIVFTTENLKEFNQVNDYYHVCNIRRTEAPYVVMSKGMCFVIIELGKFHKSLDGLVDLKDDWCYMLKHAGEMTQSDYLIFQKKGGIMSDAINHLWTLSQDETIRELLMIQEREKKDQMAREEFVREEGLVKGREEGLVKGREEGLVKGREEGLVKGREEGLVKGREEGYKDVALNLLRQGVDPQIILDSTELSEKELEDLKNHHK